MSYWKNHQWNSVEIKNKENNILKSNNNFYFVHSFYAKPKFLKDIFSYTNYSNLKFCSGIKKDNLYGVQFHPEKSGKNGIQFLENLLRNKYERI